jgi:hypothetical protein
MDRRDFMMLMAAASGAPALGLAGTASAAETVPVVSTESRAAFEGLLTLLQEIDVRYLGPEWHISQPQDIADGHRDLLHLLSAGLDMIAEADPERPVFHRMVSPTRKFQGDNPDAIYFSALIRDDRAYRIRGNAAGAVYTSISMEVGSADGKYPTGVARAINDKEIKIAADGSYELILSPEQRPGNWFKLEPGVGSVTTRHYFETEHCIAADLTKVVPLTIEPLDPVGPKLAPTVESIAASIRAVSNWMRGFTLQQPPMIGSGRPVPGWVSLVPNKFNQPALPDGTVGFANRDAHYAMAPYFLKPDEALVIEGRYPKCRFANVMLWNRFLQTYDYVTHKVSLNRRQTVLEPDGGFRMIVAHEDPGLPNWLETQGRPSGLIYWRFIFPDEPIRPLVSRVVPLASLGKH